MFSIKSVLYLLLLIGTINSQSFPIKTEFLDCFSDDDTTEIAIPADKIDCKAINPQLANCTCTKDYIDCSSKNFYSIPNDLTKMPDTVTRLFFSRNQINSLGKIELSPKAAITAIDIRKNKINKIDTENFFTPQLVKSLDYLSMCGNLNLNDFNSINGNFTNLTFLELNHVIETFEIKDGFFSKERFPSLKKLNLNDANLKIGNHPFDRLDKLELLRLDSNRLIQLPCESFLEMLSLTSLNLNNNFLSKKPDVSQDCLKNCNELSELHLQHNELTENDLTWMNLAQFKKLKKLDLSANKFSNIPYATLKDLKNMTSLKITVNERKFSMPDSASKELWPKLVYLDLSGSTIGNIGSDSFELISTNLHELILQRSEIDEINADAFGKLDSLILLDLSDNNLKTLQEPTSLAEFNYDILRGNVNLTHNKFDCTKEIEWLINFYEYEHFDKSISCHLINGTSVPVYDFIISNKIGPVIPEKTSSYNILAIIMLVLILLVIVMGVVYVVRRKQMKIRQQQYRYRYFTERSQDDGFDTDNVPVYRDCTVSLRIQDTDDTNIINTNGDSRAVLTEQPEVVA